MNDQFSSAFSVYRSAFVSESRGPAARVQKIACALAPLDGVPSKVVSTPTHGTPMPREKGRPVSRPIALPGVHSAVALLAAAGTAAALNAAGTAAPQSS